MGRREFIRIYDSYVDTMLISRVLVPQMYGNGCNKSIELLLAHSANHNFGYEDYNIELDNFIFKCAKKDGSLSAPLSPQGMMEYAKSFVIDSRYSEEFSALFNSYFNIRRNPDVQRKMHCVQSKNFNPNDTYLVDGRCLQSQVECLTRRSRSLQNYKEDLKSSKSLSNLNDINSRNDKILNHMLAASTILAIGVILMFICICYFKSKSREWKDTDGRRSRRIRTRISKSNTESSCLEKCVKSLEVNCKRGQ